jgi:DNA replicative helicase MCM subunit Mcm2 (Cdc46/Mcm family)
LTWKKRNKTLPLECKIDYSKLQIDKAEILKQGLNEELGEILLHYSEIPEELLSALNLALDVYATYVLNKNPIRIITRIINYGNVQEIETVNCSKIGRFVKVMGRVTKVSFVKLLVVTLPMTCLECGDVLINYLRNGIY